MEYDRSDETKTDGLHQRIFEGTVEANKVICDIAEKLIGADEMLRMIDLGNIERDAFDQLSNSERTTYLKQLEEAYDDNLGPSWKYASFITQIQRLMDNLNPSLGNFWLVGIDPGEICLSKDSDFEDRKIIHHILTVKATGATTEMVQTTAAFDTRSGIMGQWEEEEASTTIQALSEWLDSLNKTGAELLQLETSEIHTLLEAIDK